MYPVLIFMLSVDSGKAQDTARVHVTARVKDAAVLLRWGATTPMAWQQTNRYGFRIERYTVLRDRQVLPKVEKTVLAEILRAQPVENWEQAATTDDNAAIIAQALYGEDFELTGNDAQGFARIINLSQQLEQRFSVSLYAAGRNFEAACMAGWGWRDTGVRAGEKYLYRIVPLVPASVMKIDTGYVYIGPDDREPLPEPQEPAAVFGDRSVMLTWDYSSLSNIYNSYFVEKSTNGENFTPLPGLPVTDLNNRNDRASGRMFFSDSLAANGQTCHYRIRGLDGFGETGPPSAAVSGSGRSLLAYVPGITRAAVNERGAVEVEWEFDSRGNELITGFDLNRSDKSNGEYVAVQRHISPLQRKTVFNDLYPANYFTVSAVPAEGEPTVSFPVLVQTLDTVPPATPVALAGAVDTAGVVTLQWAPNREPDLLGYRIYRALRKGDELTPLFDRALRDTVFRDTIDVRNLNTHVYYAASAVDMRYNQSPHSHPLELAKPVLVAPSSPVFSSYRVTAEGISLEWVNSPDETVTEHRLYRKMKDSPDSTRTLLQRFAGRQTSSYTDATVEAETGYVYTLAAACENGLESVPSPAVTVFGGLKQDHEIARFDARADRKSRSVRLVWSANLNGVQTYELYRGADGQPPALWKTVPASISEITDGEVPAGEVLYLLRAVYRNGKNSKMKTVQIKL